MSNLLNKIKLFVKLYLLKNRHQRAFSRWFMSKGDATLRLEYDLNEDSVVFDLGGYKGDFAAAIHNRYGCSAYVFEPVKDFCDEIKSRFKGNNKIKIFNFGLADTDKNVSMSLGDDASSVYSSDDIKSENVILRDIVNFIRSEKLTRIDLIKINIEGGEYDVLPRLIDSGMIAAIGNLQIQFHNFINNAVSKRKKIRAELKKTHALTYDFYFVWENWSKKRG